MTPRVWLDRLAGRTLSGPGVQRRFNGEQLRLPARWARFYPEVYEPEKYRFVRANCPPGGTVVDAGAHIGVYTVVMARAVGPAGRVLSLEPAPRTRAVLTAVVEMNGVGETVEVRPEALGATEGTSTLHVPPRPISNASSTVRSGARPDARPIEVPATTIGSLLGDAAADLIKLDIEGDELDALRSARELLSRARPALAVEVHPEALSARGQSATEVLELLEEAGYRIGDAAAIRALLAADPRTGPFELQALHPDRPGSRG